MSHQLLLELLSAPDWGQYQPLIDSLHRWQGYALLEQAILTLNRSALFESAIHGPGHIDRTICHGAFCAMADNLSLKDTRLLLLACSYHDVGRLNDSLDDLHGWRAAQKIPALTGLEGQDLKIVQAAVDAHSRSDTVLASTVQSYHLADFDRGIRIATLLKDADGLDRVRIWDLDPAYLRRAASRERAGFAKELYLRYQKRIRGIIVPDFAQKWKHLDPWGNPLPPSP